MTIRDRLSRIFHNTHRSNLSTKSGSTSGHSSSSGGMADDDVGDTQAATPINAGADHHSLKKPRAGSNGSSGDGHAAKSLARRAAHKLTRSPKLSPQNANGSAASRSGSSSGWSRLKAHRARRHPHHHHRSHFFHRPSTKPRRILHPSERPVTEANLRHQEMLSGFSLTFGRRGSMSTLDISPGASRAASLDFGPGHMGARFDSDDDDAPYVITLAHST